MNEIQGVDTKIGFLKKLRAEAAKSYPSVEFMGETVWLRPIEPTEIADIVVEAKRYGASLAPIGADKEPPSGLHKSILDAAMSSENGENIRSFLGYQEPVSLAENIMYYSALMSYRYFQIARSLTNGDGTEFLPDYEDRVEFASTLLRNPHLAERFKVAESTEDTPIKNSLETQQI